MTRRLAAAAAFACLLPLTAAPVPKGLKRSREATAHVGTWRAVKSSPNGSQGDVTNVTWRFDPDGKVFVIYTDTGRETEMLYTLDPSGDPMGLEWRSGPDAKPALGAYRVDGDTLFLVHAYSPNDPRPTTFAPYTGVYYAEFRREPATK